jgi:hypothetical protein
VNVGCNRTVQIAGRLIGRVGQRAASEDEFGIECHLRDDLVKSQRRCAELPWSRARTRRSRLRTSLSDELDPIGRFAAERLAEDPTGFLSTEELTTAYSNFLHDNDYETVIEPPRLIRKLKELPGVKQLTRVASDGVRRRRLTGRKPVTV